MTIEDLKIKQDIDKINTNISRIGLSNGDVGILRRFTDIDIDTVTESSFAYINECRYGDNILSNGYLITLVYSSDYMLQLYTNYHDVSTLAIEMRKKVNGVWTDWLAFPK